VRELIPVRNVIFAPFGGYYELIVKTLSTPPEVKGEFDRAFTEGFRAMVTPLQDQASPVIEEFAFRTVSCVLTNKNHVTRSSDVDCSRVLLVAAAMLLWESLDLTDIIFRLVQRFFEIGIARTALLVAVMVGVVEKRAVFSREHIAFLSSLSLFQPDAAVPSFLIEFVSKRVAADAASYLPETGKILEAVKHSVDLRDHVYFPRLAKLITQELVTLAENSRAKRSRAISLATPRGWSGWAASPSGSSFRTPRSRGTRPPPSPPMH
jgi:hypothetical protein